MTILAMANLDLNGKRVLIREDLNVPTKGGKIVNDARIRAALPSLELALKKGACVMVMSHLGRPKEGVPMDHQPDSALAPVAEHLGKLLGHGVEVMSQSFSEADSRKLKPGQCVLLENVRCNVGENANTDELSKYYASLCDVFVMDAFGTAHRAQARRPVELRGCVRSDRGTGLNVGAARRGTGPLINRRGRTARGRAG